MEQIVFPVPSICEFLTKESKLRIYYTTERDEQGSKINDFFLRSEDLFNEMNWQKKLRGESQLLDMLWECTALRLHTWPGECAYLQEKQCRNSWCWCPPLNTENLGISIYGPNLRALNGLCSCSIGFDWPGASWMTWSACSGISLWKLIRHRKGLHRMGSLGLRMQTGTPVPETRIFSL